ncbi:MAG: TonB-dependent receptor [Rikenellaceae bacterium]|nr:TonB-dependent receptor [Rikenellaceae bacterium]
MKTSTILMTALLTVLACPFGLSAQSGEKITQTIRGTVTDEASGAPVAHAAVVLPGLPGSGMLTDENGHFQLTGIPPGRHTVQAALIGYEPAILREILVSTGKQVDLQIAMRERVKKLEEIVIRPRVNKEEALNPMAVSGARMLSMEEARRYAGGMDDPARLVGSFAGVSSDVSHNGISIHGNSPHMLQWRLEDVEIPNPNHYADISILGGGILSSLSSHVLGNSDFFTGAFPAEYANAVSGVFDMRMRTGNNFKHENTFQVGVLGIDVASEGPLSRNSNASCLFNYRYSTLGLMNKLDKSVDLGGELDYQDLNVKLNFPTAKAGTFSIWGTALRDKFSEDYEQDPTEWEHTQDNFIFDSKQYMAAAGLSHRYFITDRSTLKTTAALTFFQHDAFQTSHDTQLIPSPYMDLSRRQTNLVLTSAYNHKFGSRHTNKTGFTYTRINYLMNMDLAPAETHPLETISKGDGQTNLINLYTQSAIHLSDRLTLNLGVSSQVLTLSNSWTVEPRAGIK